MKRLISLLLSIIIYSQYSFAVCSKPVTYLKEGQAASCTGYLFTEEKEKQVRESIMKLEKMEVLVESQRQFNVTLESALVNKAAQNENLQKQLDNAKNKSIYETILYFSLGLVIGGFTVDAIKK